MDVVGVGVLGFESEDVDGTIVLEEIDVGLGFLAVSDCEEEEGLVGVLEIADVADWDFDNVEEVRLEGALVLDVDVGVVEGVPDLA